MANLDLILLRHGESEWNKENRFTGWQDVGLSEKGREEALDAGRVLKRWSIEEKKPIALAYTSVLRRALWTLWLALDELDLLWIPVEKTWRLNERHYGALTGLNKAETAARHGEEQVKIWRRSYDVPPPTLELSDPRHPSQDPRYNNVAPKDLPSSESLKSTVARVLPFWTEKIVPSLKSGQVVLVAAHGNSLRALIQHLEGLTPEQIMEVNVPTGIPLYYQLSSDLKVLKKTYLGDPEKVKAAIEGVANQGKAKPNKDKA